MKKGNTVYEDRELKKQRDLEKHTVVCPNCKRPVLDHMTECPYCKTKLPKTGYRPLSDEKIKKIRIVTYTVGGVIAVLLIVLLSIFS